VTNGTNRTNGNVSKTIAGSTAPKAASRRTKAAQEKAAAVFARQERRRLMQTEELLKVLDLPEEELNEWFYKNQHRWRLRYLDVDGTRLCSLADLAFRLRDEAKKIHKIAWWLACYTVSLWLLTKSLVLHNWNDVDIDSVEGYEAGILRQSPMVWIVTAQIAAIIAKELEKK